MVRRSVGIASFVFAAGMAMGIASAHAEANAVQKQCAAEWKAAKEAGKVPAGQKWPAYYSDCAKAKAAAPAAAAPAAAAPAAPAAAAPAAPAAPAKPVAAAPATPAKPAVAAPATAGAATFPAAVSAKYASETPGKQRMKTCLDQYKANKATNANGGLKWIQKGGGYYSECNKKLGGGDKD